MLAWVLDDLFGATTSGFNGGKLRPLDCLRHSYINYKIPCVMKQANRTVENKSFGGSLGVTGKNGQTF